MTATFGLIRFSGDKTLSVIQGQSTQMVTNLTEGSSPLLAFCDPKGRMYGSGRLVIHQNTVSMITPIDQSEMMLKKLRPFMALSRVSIEMTTIPVALTRDPDLEPSQSHHGSLITRVGEYGGTQWMIGDINAAHDPLADCQRIEAGLGYVRSYSSEQFIPQQAHYQMRDGVNFKKGCYTGQEVIARLEHLGKNKRCVWIYKGAKSIKNGTILLDDQMFPVFDAANTNESITALVLASVDSKSEQLIGVPFEISRQVEGQRPIKL